MTTQSTGQHGAASQSIWVLIVEDDQSHRQVLSDIVRSEGYHAVACGTAGEAIQVIDTQPFVVAILDQRLPDTSGIDLLQRLRQRGKDLRVIIHTGYGSFESAKEAVNLNAFAYVEKLSDPEQLISQLHRAVQDYIAAALRRSESELASVMAYAPDMICRVDQHGIVEFINHAESGATAEELIGTPADQWIEKAQRPAMQRAWREVIMTGRAQEVEVQSVVTGRWYSCHLGPIQVNGRISSAILIAHDITDRKTAEQALRHHQEELEQRVQQRTAELHHRENQERWFHEKLTQLNRTSNKLTACPTVESLCRTAVQLGVEAVDLDRLRICLYDSAERRLQGMWAIDEKGRISDVSDCRKQVSAEQSNVLQAGFCLQHDVELIDSSDRPVGRGSRCECWMFEGEQLFGRIVADNLLTGKPITEAHGELLELYAATLAHLITRIQAEEQASRHQAELARVSRLATLGEMASGLAHELNQPLAAIVNFTQGTIRRANSGKLGPDDLNAVLRRTADQALRAGRIIQRLRSFVRPQEPGGEVVCLRRAIDDSLGLLEGQLKQSGVQTRVHCPEPSPQVYGDAIQIEQVLINLVLNAIDAMEQTPIDQRLLTVRVEREDGNVHLRILDRGCGLPPTTTEIFDPFVSTKPQGMGMGLSISRSLIQAHRGQLLARPNPSGGAEFVCVLPVVENEDKTPGPTETG